MEMHLHACHWHGGASYHSLSLCTAGPLCCEWYVHVHVIMQLTTDVWCLIISNVNKAWVYTIHTYVYACTYNYNMQM